MGVSSYREIAILSVLLVIYEMYNFHGVGNLLQIHNAKSQIFASNFRFEEVSRHQQDEVFDRSAVHRGGLRLSPRQRPRGPPPGDGSFPRRQWSRK